MKFIKKYPLLFLLFVSAVAALILHKIGYTYSDIPKAADAVRLWGGAAGSAAKPEEETAVTAKEKQMPEAFSPAEGEAGPQYADMPKAKEPGIKLPADASGRKEPGQLAEEETAQEGKPRYTLAPVGDDYFKDAVFIGDSRTVGLAQYGNMPQAAFYAETGFTIYKFSDAKIVALPDEKEKLTVEEALARRQFGKVYLMVGINEMGRGTVEEFGVEYAKVVERIAALQPDALIILEAIMYVGKEKSDSDEIFNNANIALRNAAIASLADNKRIFYFDMNPTVIDEEGFLRKDYSFDGVHLRGQYVSIWRDYLYTNGVVAKDSFLGHES